MSAAVETLTVWCPDVEDEPARPNAAGPYSDIAALTYAERKWHADADYPESYLVHVRGADGQLHRFEVDVEMVPEFHSRRLEG